MSGNKVRPGFMGIGYFEDVDATPFIESARQQGVVDLTEEEQQAHQKDLSEDMGKSLKTYLGKLEIDTKNVVDLLSRVDKLTFQGAKDGSLSKMDTSSQSDLRKMMKKVQDNLEEINTFANIFMHDTAPRLKKL